MDQQLIGELRYLAAFITSTHRGEPIPLADFTRERMAKAMNDAAKAIEGKSA